MNRTEALLLLAQHKAQLVEQFGVTSLVLFGSKESKFCTLFAIACYCYDNLGSE